MLEEINRRVQLRVNNSHKKIIQTLFKGLIDSHEDLCDCNYCHLLKECIRRERYLPVLVNLMKDTYYDGRHSSHDVNDFYQLKNEIFLLKTKMKSLKEF